MSELDLFIRAYKLLNWKLEYDRQQYREFVLSMSHITTRAMLLAMESIKHDE